jgi:hypothetical protein
MIHRVLCHHGHKLFIDSRFRRHWLSRSHRHTGCKLVKRATVRRSAVIQPLDVINHSDDNSAMEDIFNGCTLSADSDSGDRSISLSITASVGNVEDTRPWATLNLSTTHKLISPQPLGPTHILVVFNTSSSRSHTYLECPINNLIFLLNSLNLANPGVLSRRLPSELPIYGCRSET